MESSSALLGLSTSRREILALFLLPLSQSNARTATVLVDELYAGDL
jgi:hypothetical protein